MHSAEFIPASQHRWALEDVPRESESILVKPGRWVPFGDEKWGRFFAKPISSSLVFTDRLMNPDWGVLIPTVIVGLLH